MKVVKRNGTLVDVRFDEITDRIKLLCSNLDSSIDPAIITQEISRRVYDGITTSELDHLTSEYCAVKAIKHPDYGVLASRIAINDHQKNVLFHYPTFSKSVDAIYMEPTNDCISKEFHDMVMRNADTYDSMVDNTRDFVIDYFGFKTLQRSYFLKIKQKMAETTQYLFLRVAIGIHGENFDLVAETYNLMSEKYFTHASPTLFNAGSPKAQYLSCFLLGTKDSIEGIYKTISDCAYISKWSGGIGVHISNIRANGSYIKGTGGKSDGIVPMLKVYNSTARYINQGGRRLGSFAMYLEPWHADVFEFLMCKRNHGSDEVRSRDLFYALWVPDFFMEQVQNNSDWYLMCPSECPGLNEVYGDDFNNLYCDYVAKGKYRKKIKARELWNQIINSQIETGVPYIAYKDTVNRKSNQKNVGIIKSSNLCIEICQYSDDKEYACCNLASICLPMFVREDREDRGDRGVKTFDYEKLEKIAGCITRNLNKIIDGNYYPVPETKISNLRHRPIGIGVQGLADTLFKMGLPFESKEALELNRKIFESIYLGALTESNKLAMVEGPYETFEGSPFSQGKFQFDLVSEFDGYVGVLVSPENEARWESLRQSIQKYGLRNSLLTSVMPTASTSQIMGNYECVELPTSNIYKRRTLAGEFPVINKYLVRDLISLGLWDSEMQYRIVSENGSIQNIGTIPERIRELYKTMWEVKQRSVIDMASIRSLYIDQSQSMNLYFAKPDFNLLQKAHFYGWNGGNGRNPKLKTGSYYIRSRPSIDSDSITNTKDESCLNCSA